MRQSSQLDCWLFTEVNFRKWREYKRRINIVIVPRCGADAGGVSVAMSLLWNGWRRMNIECVANCLYSRINAVKLCVLMMIAFSNFSFMYLRLLVSWINQRHSGHRRLLWAQHDSWHASMLLAPQISLALGAKRYQIVTTENNILKLPFRAIHFVYVSCCRRCRETVREATLSIK